MNMKSFVLALSLATASVLAQTIDIITPSLNQTLTIGQKFTVEVLKPDYIQSSTDIGISISLAHCPTSPCPDMTERLGTVLYAGGYDPKTQAPGELTGFYQNFSVKTPDIQTGLAVLSVVHLELIGAGPEAFTEIKNTTVWVVEKK